MSASPSRRLYALLVDDPDRAASDPELDERTAEAVPRNAARMVTSLLLTKAGDRIVDPKTVLTWLLSALGAPAATIGLLVPIRESGSMLPQAALVPLVRRTRRRSHIWVAGAVGQLVAILLMIVAAATTRGTLAGVTVLGALALFALARSLASIASKDVLGRTVPKGQRGRITGWAATGSGLVAITIGLAIRALGASGDPGEDVPVGGFLLLLGGAAVAWAVAAAVFSRVEDPPAEPDDDADTSSTREALRLLRTDAPFRRFVLARTLLLVSALTPPFVVTIATERGGLAFGALGPFVVAAGVASLVGGRVWGGLADRSSRRVMVVACAAASIIVVAYVALLRVESLAGSVWFHPAVYLLLAVVHTGARVGRKTYVVDLAEGDRRTSYVAVSNTAMGVLLLVVGGVTAGLGTLGPEVALLALAAIGAAGVPTARTLPDV
ncbi:MAG: MFS transporter [Actinomycetes bacterium]